MQLSNFIRVSALLVGVVLLCFAASMLWLAGSGLVIEGKSGAYLLGVSLVAVSVLPLLVAARLSQLARLAGLTLLVLIALAMLWAAFGSSSTTPTLAFQLASVAFALLVLFRIYLAIRHSRQASGA